MLILIENIHVGKFEICEDCLKICLKIKVYIIGTNGLFLNLYMFKNNGDSVLF
jgi:hypothetical protein